MRSIAEKVVESQEELKKLEPKDLKQDLGHTDFARFLGLSISHSLSFAM